MPDEDLCNAVVPGVIHDGGDRIASLQYVEVGILRSGEDDVTLVRQPVFLGQVFLHDVDREQLVVKTIGVAAPASAVGAFFTR